MKSRKKDNVGITVTVAPERNGKKNIPELPFHILFAGALTPGQKSSDNQSLEPGIATIDKETFPAFMRQHAPLLTIEVADHIGGSLKPVEWGLSFPDMRSFRPEGIIQQVPALKKLVQTRALIERVKRGDFPLSEFQKNAETAGLDADIASRFQQILSTPHRAPVPRPSIPPSESGKPKERSKLSSLFEMVDLAARETSIGGPEPVDTLISAIAESDQGMDAQYGAVEKSVADVLVNDLDQIIGDQVNSIIHHRDFMSLEASWRSLKFLVDRLDFRRNVLLSVLSVARSDLSKALDQLLNPNAVGEPLAEAPVSVVIAEYEFGNSVAEIQELDTLAQTVAGLQTPLVSGVGFGFFGRSKAAEMVDLPVLRQHFQNPEYITWNSLRRHGNSNYIALALPRFLLRFPYGEDNPVKEFQFVESSGNGSGVCHSYCWGNAAVILAVAMARSFVETGWPARFTGLNCGMVKDLPIRGDLTAGVRFRTALECALPDDKMSELSDAGFAVLACRPNEDSAYIACAPTIHLSELFDEPEANEDALMHATLGCKLVASRVVQHLARFRTELASGLSVSSLRSRLKDHLCSLFSNRGKPLPQRAVAVESSEPAYGEQHFPVSIRITTPPEILGRPVRLVMGFDVLRR